jgi:hypothetical protein
MPSLTLKMRKQRRRGSKHRRKSTRKHRMKGGAKREFHFYNRFHYGDTIFNLKFFKVNADLLKKNNIHVNYYYDPGYIKKPEEFENYIDKDCMSLKPIAEKPADATELWQGIVHPGVRHNPGTEPIEFEKYYESVYRGILKTLGLPAEGVDVSMYQPESYLSTRYDALDSKYKDVDVLINTCPVMSGQAHINQEHLNTLSVYLSHKFKVVTTCDIDESIPSTMRDSLPFIDVGAISTHAKYIITSNSGSIAAMFNKAAKEYVKHWFILSDPARISLEQIPYTATTNMKEIEKSIQ